MSYLLDGGVSVFHFIILECFALSFPFFFFLNELPHNTTHQNLCRGEPQTTPVFLEGQTTNSGASTGNQVLLAIGCFEYRDYGNS